MIQDTVMVAPFGYYTKGTVRARMVPIAEELEKQGYQVTIVIPPWDNPSEGGKRRRENGVELIHLDTSGDSVLNHIQLSIKTVRKVRGLDPDIVHVFKPIGEAGMTALVFSLLTDYPVILDSDDWEGNGGQRLRRDRSKLANSLLNLQEQYIPRTVDAVTVASRSLETQMWGNKIPPERTFYAPNGQTENQIQMDRANDDIVRRKYEIGENPLVLLYTRFFEYDLNKVARIVAETIEHNAKTEFVVVGKGRYDEHDEFAAEIQSLGLTDSVHMVGWVEFDELPNYFAAADIAIYPFDDTLINRSKCPAKLTELLVAGVPVVADNVGQISEYIHHDESGVLVEPGNEEQFVKEILRLLNDGQRRDKIAEAARNRMLTKFSWSSITDKVEDAYKLAAR